MIWIKRPHLWAMHDAARKMEHIMARILVPLDGSPASGRAVKHVVSLLDGRAENDVHLLHVQPPLVAQDVPDISRPGLSGRLGSEDVDRAFGTATCELEHAGIRHTAHTARGDPAQEIAFYADIHGCDHIVMGTRGLGSIRNLLLGSVATKVLHLVKVPVTLVK